MIPVAVVARIVVVVAVGRERMLMFLFLL